MSLSLFPPTGSPIHESSGLFKLILDNLVDGVYFTDHERRITYWNMAAETLTGYTAKEVVGSLCADSILMHVDDTGCVLCEGDCPLSRAMVEGRPHRSDVFIRHKQGHRVPAEVRVCPVTSDDGRVIGAVEIFNDNSRQRAIRERATELTKLAFLDPASQVANRHFLDIQLAQQLNLFSTAGKPFGILLCDLDKFKKINDTYGHLAGDAALVTVAKTLSGCLRATDVLGRWGGDEFMVILPGVTQKVLDMMTSRCKALVARSEVPVEGALIKLTISVGATLVEPGDTAESILNRADQNLYLCKLPRQKNQAL
jgi:diguanylate cyclase (GGDEF)-like protein/PAS domain S-box-containing protein